MIPTMVYHYGRKGASHFGRGFSDVIMTSLELRQQGKSRAVSAENNIRKVAFGHDLQSVGSIVDSEYQSEWQ